MQALQNIYPNKGIITPGVDEVTIDGINLKRIRQISEELKNGTYKFTPTKRVFVDKTNMDPKINTKLLDLAKKGALSKEKIKEMKARPLGIPSFNDKIVQEATRMVLEAIYDPVFQRLDVSYGFRANHSCHDAITKLVYKFPGMDYAVEGDISGAYDNVNFDILIEIMSKKVKDKKLLKLIRKGLEAGIDFEGLKFHTTIGTTQGSVLSPLLYNIYYHEIDEYIQEIIVPRIEKENISEGRKKRATTKDYRRLSKHISKINIEIRKLKEKIENIYKDDDNAGEEIGEITELIRNKLKEQKEQRKERGKIQSTDTERRIIRIGYVRYADDWVILTNNVNVAVDLVKELKTVIYEKLKLELSEQKTKVTDLRKEHMKFLGFQLTQKKAPKRFHYYKIKDQIAVSDKINMNRLFVSWDRNRVLKRMEQAGFIQYNKNIKQWRGKRKYAWSHLPIFKIIQAYNYRIRGVWNYYAPVCTYPSSVQYLIYLYTYSCYHTLANKYDTSIRKIINKYGKDLNIKMTEKGIVNGKEIETTKSMKLITYNELAMDLKIKKTNKKKNKEKALEFNDIFTDKLNYTIPYKL